jgi:death-on-curing protein
VTEPRWVNKLSLVLLHAESLSEFGGGEGLRDDGLLESALARARNLFAYEGVTDLAALAAAYSAGIAHNHPFVDGNKRAALLVIELFLQRNGYSFAVDKVDGARRMFSLASGEMTDEMLANWIRDNMVKAEAQETP